VGHRSSTTFRQLGRSWALVFASFQDGDMVLSSLSSVLFYVRTVFHCLLLPCGFQSRDWRTMLFGSLRRVCPIHRHFLFLMVSVMGTCLVVHHRSWLEIGSGQRIWRICLRHVFANTFSFSSSDLVCLHVSDSYRKVKITLDLKSLCLVDRRMFLFFQMSLSEISMFTKQLLLTY